MASAGMAMLQGYWYANTESLTLPVQAASATLPRIDRVVLRLDLTSEARNIGLAVITGTPAISPYPPNLTRDDNVYELSLAQLSIPAGAVAVASVTDERYNGAVCGITHGLYTVDLTDLQEEHQAMLDDIRAQAQAAIEDFESTGGAVFAERIKAVDGAGSGIDADLLDGQHGSYYASASHTHTLSALGAQKAISSGTSAPSGGASGDIYIQY